MVSLRSHVVLLVEDNADDERLMLRALGMNGQRSHLMVARDGDEALRILHGSDAASDPQAMPSLILLDLKLPRMNGIEVLRSLRSDPRTSRIPVVVLTSSDEERDIADAYAAGANSYVRKPIDYEEYIDAVRQMEQYWLFTNVQPPVGAGSKN